MNKLGARTMPILVVVALLCASSGPVVGSAVAQEGGPLGPQSGLALAGVGFTYQGRLANGGSPVSDSCSMAFRLYDAASGGLQVGNATTQTNVLVSDGLFSVLLNSGGEFGAQAFNGSARWLGIAVQCPPDGGFTSLTPRQALTPAPYAYFAGQAPWTGLTDMPAGFADGVDHDTTYSAGAGLALTGTTFNLLLAGSGSAGSAARSDHDHNSDYWALGGNSATTGAHYLGTSDNMTLTLAVSGTAALRLVPNDTSPNIIGGYIGNSVPAGVVGAIIAGGGSPDHINTASDTYATVSGGWDNTASDSHATVSGGYDNTASGFAATVSGGYTNTASGTYATVSGGYTNTASGYTDMVGGGEFNIASGSWSMVGGGYGNTASQIYATVGGGGLNSASGSRATVGGGDSNTASGYAATVGGGRDNTASYFNSTVGGGRGNTASGTYATVDGGWDNTASGYAATVGGGRDNTASGDYSFAAGRLAGAIHQGAFVWADSSGTPISSTTDNQFLVRASGGITMYTSSDATTGVAAYPGSGSWTSASDRNLKANFAPVDGRDVLAALVNLPLETWNYQAQNASIRHMGPMAQDFHAAFGLGETDLGISAVDADGIALAAIQGLHSLVVEKDAEIAALQSEHSALQSEHSALQAEQTALEARLVRLEQAAGIAPAPAATLWLLGLTLAALAVLIALAGGVFAGRRLAAARERSGR